MTLPNVFSFASVASLYMSEPYASLLNGMVLGIDLPKTLEIYDYFKKTGLLHLVVLSGSNINFLVVTTTRIFQRFGTTVAAILSLCVVTSFIMFVGPEPPVVRAGFMSASTLLALIFHRQSIALFSLCLTAVCIGIYRFEWLSTISFQLSFGASLGIILWSPSSQQKSQISNTPQSLFHKIYTAIIADVHTTLAAQAVTTPIIFYYFREVSLIAPVSNAAVGFATGPIMILGLIAIFIGKFIYIIGYIPAKIAYIFLWYICSITHMLASLPYVFVKF